MDVVTFETKVFEDIRKMQRTQRKEHVSMDNSEICEVARRTPDNVLVRKIAVIRNTFKVELEADRITIYSTSTHYRW